MRRNLKIKPLIGWIARLCASLMMGAAVFADTLGLDRSGGWGPARIFLLGCGILLLLASVAGDLWRMILDRWSSIRGGRITIQAARPPKREYEPPSSVQAGSLAEDHLARRRRRVLAIAFLFFLIHAVGVSWLISVGTWNEWPKSTEYFHDLAAAFRSGQTSLLIDPDPRLLALENPLEFENRREIPQLWDATLYDGKYYLYWGPAPAVVTVLLELIFGRPVGDQFLVWMFNLGSVFWILAILVRIFLRHFNRLPPWSFFLAGLSILFVNPFLWMVSRPAVYEAAIQSAQFFFLGGVFFFLQLLSGKQTTWKQYFWIGFFWTLTVASRVSFVTVVVPASLWIVLRLIREGWPHPWRRGTIFRMLSFSLPLIVGGLGLAAYNFVRFGSVFEFGHRYALSSWDMSADYRHFIFSLKNFGPNVYNYFFNTYRPLGVFPFIKPRWGVYSVPFLRMLAGTTYSTEQVTGIMISSPAAFFTLVPLGKWLLAFWKNLDRERPSRLSLNPFADQGTCRVFLALNLVLLLIMLPLLFFHANSMRYLMDFVPVLMISSVLGYWSLARALEGHAICSRALLVAFTALSIYGCVVGFLLGITGYVARFETYNPGLFDLITRSLSW
jgi:hypothetical protein